MTRPVVLLHALSLNSTMWAPQRAALIRSGHRVFAPDLRGHGLTPLGDRPPSVDVLADDLARALDRYGIDDVVLAGVSLGGYVALSFLRRHPGRTSALALIATRVGPDDEPTACRRRRFADLVQDPATAPAVVESAIPMLLGATSRARRPDLLRRVAAMARAADPAALAWCQRAIAGRPDSAEVLRAAGIPTAVVAGEEDELVPLAEAHRTVAISPTATLVTVPETGHLVPLEAPDVVTAVLAGLSAPAARCGRRPERRVPS